MKHYLALTAIALCPQALLANDLYLDLHSEAFHGRLDATHSSNGVYIMGEALITDNEASSYSLGLLKTGVLPNNSGIRGGLGAKGIYLKLNDDNYFAFALGGSISIPLPLPNTALAGELFYAPGITSTDELDGVIDFNARIEYRLFENGNIYAGARLVELQNPGNNDANIDNNIHVGIKISF